MTAPTCPTCGHDTEYPVTSCWRCTGDVDTMVTIWSRWSLAADPARAWWVIERSYPRWRADDVVAAMRANDTRAREYRIFPKGYNPNTEER